MNILFVHGAWHNAGCWSKLTPLLESSGISCHCLTLPGHKGREQNPFSVSMKVYSQAVCDYAEDIVKKTGEQLVLVGHSMGGLVISVAGEQMPHLFKRLIYLSALVPSQASSPLDIMKNAPNPAMRKMVSMNIFKGVMEVKKGKEKELFYHNCDDVVVNEEVNNHCPQPIRPFLARHRWSHERLGSIPKDYIECLDDRAVLIDVQRHLQKSMTFERVVSIAGSDHSPFLSQPEELASVMISLLDVSS
ncbi:alpha/beta fold hydrolase [Maricurvus nonylphenolicus]|uniref:alpha/beta fold hydrolase n=1 Tax=Maricurvus nonylphenolicus TaxID=1008307 RepID=UPI0036F200D0